MLCKHKMNELICTECEKEAYANGIRSRNGDKFFFSSYWGSWSRILVPMGRDFSNQVEVDLTAINPTSPLQWPRVASINIRQHSTALARKDKISETLPVYAFDLMKLWITDEAILDRLLHEDLMPLIDWDKYRKANNGGAALANILKESA